MIRKIAMIILVFIVVLLTFKVNRVETVKKHEWELPDSVQDSIQLVQEEGWKAYADSLANAIEQAHMDSVLAQYELINAITWRCRVLEHQNDEGENYLLTGLPHHCGCPNTTLYQ